MNNTNTNGIEVFTSHETKRGCGYRKAAKGGVGIYLMSGQLTTPCDRLPFALDVCPCCGAGVKPTRAFTWIQPQKLFQDAWATSCEDPACPMGPNAPEKAGLLWIGEAFYPTAADFLAEAAVLGISRKIPAIPRNFKVGETRIYLAHRRAVLAKDGTRGPGVFASFIPQQVDLVIDDPKDIPERALKMAQKLGDLARLVKVVPAAVLQTLVEAQSVQKPTEQLTMGL